MAVEEGAVASRDGLRLHWQSWTIPQPQIALAVAHGLGEHAGRYERLAEGVRAYGIATYAVDLRGMGRSEGRRGHVHSWHEWIEDYAAFHRLVTERAKGVEVVPLGHSFGGVLVASAVLTGAVRPRRFVLSNPAFRALVKVPGWKLAMGRATSTLLPRLTLANEVDPGLLSRDVEVGRAYAADPLVHDRISSRLFTEWGAASDLSLARASELSVPVYVIVSEADRIIDREATLEFAHRAGARATVRSYPGRYHEPFNDLGNEEVFSDLARWLSANN